MMTGSANPGKGEGQPRAVTGRCSSSTVEGCPPFHAPGEGILPVLGGQGGRDEMSLLNITLPGGAQGSTEKMSFMRELICRENGFAGSGPAVSD